jgi:RNA polymerase sigma-70 factor (family 1)
MNNNNPLPIRKEIYSLQLRVADEDCSRSFEQLYNSFYPFLHPFALRIIKSDFIAEEIVSDVFVQLWKNRKQLKEVNNLRVFLYVAVRNTALNYLYKARKEQVCWMDEFSEGTSRLNNSEDPFSKLDAKELTMRLNAVIDHLPSRCKIIYKLVKEDGLKYTETARVLNLSVKTIENQMGIALKKIAQALQSLPGA